MTEYQRGRIRAAEDVLKMVRDCIKDIYSDLGGSVIHPTTNGEQRYQLDKLADTRAEIENALYEIGFLTEVRR